MLLRGDDLLRRNPCYQEETSNYLFPKAETVAQRIFVKKLFSEFRKIHRKTPEACNFIIKETLAQVFSSEFWEISINTFFHRTPAVAALRAASFVKLCCITLGQVKIQKINLFFGRNHNVFLATLQRRCSNIVITMSFEQQYNDVVMTS